MATVRGEPVYMDDLYDILVEKYGMAFAQQILANRIVDAEAERLNLVITKDDLAAERDYLLDDLARDASIGQAERDQLLAQVLSQWDMSEADLTALLRRDAILRKIITPTVRVSDPDLRREFGHQYGRKVQIRHIQVESRILAQELLQRARDGEDFSTLAHKYSVNGTGKATGGLLPPFGLNVDPSETITPAIRTAALSLDEPGQLSGLVRTDTAYHILYLEKVIPPQDVDFERVREDLTIKATKRKVRQERPKLLLILMKNANVQYVNPILRKQQADALNAM